MNGKAAVAWYIYHRKFGNYTFCIGGQSGFRLSNYYKEKQIKLIAQTRWMISFPLSLSHSHNSLDQSHSIKMCEPHMSQY